MPLAVALAAISGLMAFSTDLGIDYFSPPCGHGICDDPAMSIDALMDGKPGAFFANQPPMGSFSLLVRVPFAELARIGHRTELTTYRFGALACLLAVALVAFAIAVELRGRGLSWIAWAVLPGFLLANPLTVAALHYGHPEELLAGALCVAAVLLARRRRLIAAGIVIGCAIATKQWAVLGLIALLAAAPTGARRSIGAAAIVTALALTLPMAVANPARFVDAQRSVGVATSFQGTITAANIWWPLASSTTGAGIDSAGGRATITQYSLPAWLGELTHPLVIVTAIALALLYVRRRRGRDPAVALGLIALVFLLRCILDPLTYSYHHAPFLIALIAYELLTRRIPTLSVASIACVYATDLLIAPLHDAAATNAFYLCWSLPLAVLIAGSVFRSRSRQPLPAAA